MPQIVEYNAPEGLGLRPTETGIESVAGAARRVQGAYNEAAELKSSTGQRIGSAISVAGGEATRYATHQQISQGAAAFSGINAGYTQKWDELHKNADVANPAIGQGFLASLEGDLEKFKSGFLTEEGQQWAEHHAEQLRDHFTKKVIADRSTAEGNAIATQTAQAFNGASTSVFIDPSKDNLDFNLKTLRGHTGDVVGTSGLEDNDKIEVGGKLTQKAGEALIKSAAQGYVEKYGVLPPYLSQEKYKNFVNGPELKQLEHQAQERQKTFELQQKQLDIATKQENVKAVQEAAIQNRDNNSSFDPTTNRYTITPEFFDQADKIMHMPEGYNVGKGMKDWGQAKQREKAAPVTSDPATKTNFLERMVTPTDNPTTEAEIRAANLNGKLSDADTHKLIAYNNALTKTPIRDPIFRDVISASKKLLGTDPIGAARHADFMAELIPQYLQLPAAERVGALNLKNPDSFINKIMSDYQRTPQQKMEDHINQKLGITLSPTEPAPAFTPPPGTPPGSRYSASRGVIEWPDGSIHDAKTGALKPKTVPASQ